MGKYVKRPIVVDAEQFIGGKLVRGMHDLGNLVDSPAHRYYVVAAGKKTVYVHEGDWIIAETDGRGYYPCSAEIFTATYVPIAEVSP